MKIIISPAKKMKYAEFSFENETTPYFLNESEQIKKELLSYSVEELKEIYKCSLDLAKKAYTSLRMEEKHPALLTYDGIQYKYLSTNTLTIDELTYLSNNLIILSALYGALKPTDLISHYRLELVNNLFLEGKNLYQFWGDKIANFLKENNEIVINLASQEYSKLVEPFMDNSLFINIFFYEKVSDKYVEKGVYSKIARGLMVRFLAKNRIVDAKNIKQFNEQNYKFDEEKSDEHNYVFVRNS